MKTRLDTTHLDTTRLGRARLGAALATAVALIATPLTMVDSQASFNDREWDRARVGTLDCTTPEGLIASRSYGRLLDGSLLPIDLDTAASVKGMTTTNSGSAPTPTPATAQSAGDGAYLNPIDVSALSLIQLPLTGTSLADFLTLDLGNEVGVVNQFAKAPNSGKAVGAAGVVNDSGVVMTADDATGEPPSLGTLKLSTLVEKLTGKAVSTLVSGVSDLRLELGAVAGRASTNGCTQLWQGNANAVEREYAIAGLSATVTSPTVAGLSGTLSTSLNSVETLVDGLAGSQGVLDGLTSGLSGVLGSTLGTLKLGKVAITGTIDADLSAARALGAATIEDDAKTVSLDLATGKVSVDLAALLGEAYGGERFDGTPGHGLNGLDPNTSLVLNAPVTNALVAALTNALDGWVSDVVDAVEKALNLATVDVDVTIRLKGLVLDVAEIKVGIEGSLAELLSGDASTTTDLTLLGLLPGGLLVQPILDALTRGVGPLLGTTIRGLLFAETSAVGTLGATLSNATAPVITLLSQVLNVYLGVGGLVSLRANIQNDPAGPSAQLYDDWEAGGSDPVLPDRYAVAALGVSVLGANVNLELGRGEVGRVCLVGGSGCPPF